MSFSTLEARGFEMLRRLICRLIGHRWGPANLMFAGRRLVGELWYCERCGWCQDNFQPAPITKDMAGLGKNQ